MIPGMESRPRLAPGCRLDNKAQGSQMLLMPERALRLSGPSLEIVQRCDGQRTVQQIVSELQKVYSKAQPQKVNTISSNISSCCKGNVRWISSDALPAGLDGHDSLKSFAEARFTAKH